MRISTKLITVSCCSAVIVTGIVVSLLAVVKSESVGYNNILQGNIQNVTADRASVAVLDGVTLIPDPRVAALAQAQQTKTAHQLLMLLVVFGVILVVDSFFYCGVLFGVFRRLNQLKAVTDRLAKADIQGLSIDISGNDEIGEIGESMKGVRAAIEELLTVHAH